jgi:hypothetical protein
MLRRFLGGREPDAESVSAALDLVAQHPDGVATEDAIDALPLSIPLAAVAAAADSLLRQRQAARRALQAAGALLVPETAFTQHVLAVVADAAQDHEREREAVASHRRQRHGRAGE